jgi:hypothetical protein
MAVLGKDAQIREIIKCGKDPIYFIKKYTKIQHPMKGTIPFDTYPFQDDCVKAFEDHRFNIILKSRQLGLSTIVAAYAVWLALFRKDKNILIIATKLSVATNMMKKVKIVFQNLPKWIVIPTIASETKQTMEFDNGSTIKAVPTSEDAGRSEALSLLIVDEAAFVRDFDTIWTGIYPTLSTGGRAIILSTPNGAKGQYHELYIKAETNENSFNDIRLPWDVHPDRDEAWFAAETKNMNKKQIAQELLCDFAASGDTFVDIDQLELVRGWLKEPILRGGDDMNVWVWQMALSAHKYIMGADTARGDGQDYSTFHIIDTEDGEVVAEYKGKLKPDQFAVLVDKWGRMYNTALVVAENNSYGYATIMKLKELGYPRIYSSKQRSTVYLGDYMPSEDTEMLGFDTNSKTRPQMLTKLEEVLRNGIVHIRSRRFHDELKTFIWHNGKAQAERGKHDDLIMSLALAVWVFDSSDINSGHAAALNAAILAGMSTTKRTFDQVPNSGNEVSKHENYSFPFIGTPTSTDTIARNEYAQRFKRQFGWML